MPIDLNKYKLKDNLDRYKLPAASIAEKEPGYFSSVAEDYKRILQDIGGGISRGAEQVEKGGFNIYLILPPFLQYT